MNSSFINKILLEASNTNYVDFIYKVEYRDETTLKTPKLQISKSFFVIFSPKFLETKTSKPFTIPAYPNKKFVDLKVYYTFTLDIKKAKEVFSNPKANLTIRFREDGSFFFWAENDRYDNALEFINISNKGRSVVRELFLIQEKVREPLYQKQEEEYAEEDRREKEIKKVFSDKRGIFMIKNLNFFIDLISKGKVIPKQNFFSFTENAEALDDYQENELGVHEYGDTTVMFDKTKLPSLIKMKYNDFKFLENNPDIFEYTTSMKWSSDLKTFIKLNRKTLDNLELLNDPSSSLKSLLSEIMNDIEFEKEWLLKGTLKYTPGLILAIKSKKDINKKVRSFLESNNIKVLD